MNLEVQFTEVIDFFSVEKVCIQTGTFSGSEDINVTYWTGSTWSSITSDLTASTWNNYTVSVTSATFTIKFGGSTTSSDTTQDTWNIDAVLLQLSGAGSNETVVNNADSDVDSLDDKGLMTDFSHMMALDSSYTNLTETTTPAGVAVSIEPCDIGLTSAQTTNTYTMTLGQVAANTVPFATYYIVTAASTADDYSAYVFDLSISGTTVTATRYDTGTSAALNIYMYLVEFNPDVVRVQKGTFTISASTSTTSAITNAVDQTKTFLVFYYQSSSTAVQQPEFNVRGRFTADNELTFSTVATTTLTGTWYVVEDLGNNWDVQKADINIASGTSSNTGLITTVDMTKTFVVGSAQGGSTDDVSEGSISAYLSDSTHITLEKGGTGTGVIDGTCYAITFTSSSALVERGTIAFTSTQTALSDTSLSARDWSYGMVSSAIRLTDDGFGVGTSSSNNVGPKVRLILDDANDEIDGLRITGSIAATVRWEAVLWLVGGAANNNYTLDQEIQFIDILTELPIAELCIYAGTQGAEALMIDIWNTTSSAWNNIVADINANGWTNTSIVGVGWLASTITFRFVDSNQNSDGSTADQWFIDVAIICVENGGEDNYELDLEEQWTNANYTRANEELCIYMGTFNAGGETLSVQWWNSTGSFWLTIIASLSASQWNNVSVTAYLTSATFTIRFIDGTKTSDSSQGTWQKDACLLHTWTLGYNLNLRVMDLDLTDNIQGAYVYKDSDVKTSDADGWANWTEVSGTVQIKVQYFGFWVNETSLTISSDRTMSLQCKLYDVIVNVRENVRNAKLSNVNVTVYNSTNYKIKSGISDNNGQVSLLNLPNNTLTFTCYAKSDYSLVIKNVARNITQDEQIETIICDENYVGTTSNYSILVWVGGIVIPLEGSFVTNRLKRKMYKKKKEAKQMKTPQKKFYLDIPIVSILHNYNRVNNCNGHILNSYVPENS